MSLGQRITLDSASLNPVYIDIVAVNGNGIATTEENALSVVALVRFGQFEAVLGGDLEGSSPNVESVVAPGVGQAEVYKVHHHGSASSSNADWMTIVRPRVGVISVGPGNGYGHPTATALARLHAVGTRTYWTTVGNGATPTPNRDIVGGDIVMEVGPGATTFTVTHSGSVTDSFPARVPQPTPPSKVVINEFRPRGPKGAADEFIELRNTSSVAVNIGGWKVAGSNASGVTLYA